MKLDKIGSTVESSGVDERRNGEFHKMFRGIDKEEKLRNVFHCALQRDVLIQGRLYLSEKHLCFYSNIFGWITNITIDLERVIDIEKKSSAVIFPNSILVSTLHSKYFFTSFMAREQAFFEITELWKACHEHFSIRTVPSSTDDIFFLDGKSDRPRNPDMENVDEDSYTSSRSTCPHVVFNENYPVRLSNMVSTLFDGHRLKKRWMMNRLGLENIEIGEWIHTTNKDIVRVMRFDIGLGVALLSKTKTVVLERCVFADPSLVIVQAYVDFPETRWIRNTDIQIEYVLKSVESLGCNLEISARIVVEPEFDVFSRMRSIVEREILGLVQRQSRYIHSSMTFQMPASDLEVDDRSGIKNLLLVLLLTCLVVLWKGFWTWNGGQNGDYQGMDVTREIERSRISGILRRNEQKYRRMMERYKRNDIAIMFEKRAIGMEIRHIRRMQERVLRDLWEG